MRPPSGDSALPKRRQFGVAAQRQSNEPPRMVVKGTVIIAFVELMQAQGEATPDNPTLQVSLFVIED